MARNSFPRMRTGGSSMPSVLGVAVAVVVLVLVVRHPSESADGLRAAWTLLGMVADGLMTFVQSAAAR